MSKLVISTSSFDVDNNPHLQHLVKAGMNIVGNSFKRKLTAILSTDVKDWLDKTNHVRFARKEILY
jgi:hypothetical protein